MFCILVAHIKELVAIMKNIILFIVLTLSTSIVFGQKKSSQDVIASLEIGYGYKTYNQTFQNNFNTLGDFKFNKPLQTIGLMLSGRFTYGASGHFTGHFSYNQNIPQPIVINDTNKCQVTGFNFGFGIGRDIFAKMENFDLILCGGINTGRLRLFNNEITRQKNPYFSPKISLQPRVKIKNISISLTVEYDYDVSKPTWRKTFFSNTDKTSIDRLNQTGLTTIVGIGYAL